MEEMLLTWDARKSQGKSQLMGLRVVGPCAHWLQNPVLLLVRTDTFQVEQSVDILWQ